MKEDVIEHVHRFIEQLQKTEAFIEEAGQDPKKWLTEAGGVFGGSAKGEWFRVLDYRTKADVDERKHPKKYEFMHYVAEQLTLYVSEWAIANGIREQITVKPRHPQSFPSIFAIFTESGHEVIQFDIFRRYYGCRDLKEKGTAEGQAKKRQEEFMEELELCEKNIAYYEEVIENPYQHAKGFKDFCQILFNRKILTDSSYRLIEREEEQLKKIKDNLSRLKKWSPDAEERESVIIRFNELLTPLFEEVSFSRETERHKLY